MDELHLHRRQYSCRATKRPLDICIDADTNAEWHQRKCKAALLYIALLCICVSVNVDAKWPFGRSATTSMLIQWITLLLLCIYVGIVIVKWWKDHSTSAMTALLPLSNCVDTDANTKILFKYSTTTSMRTSNYHILSSLSSSITVTYSSQRCYC